MKISNKIYLTIFSVAISAFVTFYISSPTFKNALDKNYAVANKNNINKINIYKDSKYEESVELENNKKNLFAENMLIADLQNMKVDLINRGQVIKSFNIVSKGRPTSYYETPAGDYVIKSKQENKYSNLGHVYMPYSMQFYGNFFIHGIPYYPDGTRVSTSYSGGCIRMSDEDAKEIYEFSKVGTRLMILTNESKNENIDLGKEVTGNMLNVLVSLEVLNQEKYVTYKKEKTQIKTLNKYILENDTEAKEIVISQIGKDSFEDSKLEKAKALSLNDATFENEIDRVNLYNYIVANKSYILSLLN